NRNFSCWSRSQCWTILRCVSHNRPPRSTHRMGVAAATMSLQISREFQIPGFAPFAESAMSSSPDVEDRMKYNYGKSGYRKRKYKLYSVKARKAPWTSIVEWRNGQS